MNKFDTIYNKIITEMSVDKHKLKIKYNELLGEFNSLNAEKERLTTQSETLKSEILAKHPELAKNMDKLFKKLKDAFQIETILKIKNKPGYEDICDEWVSSNTLCR